MSINLLSLGTIGIKDVLKLDVLKSYVREHANEMVIVAIMFGISVSVAMLATGDFSEALARRRAG
jgi:glycerol uptake facilitator-like aquaporin